MPSEPLRFIHAADCLLDSPLRDVGPLPGRLVESVAAATLAAFERVLEACLERSVDFLLLTGNTFDEAEESLAARIALVEGCALLAEAEIDVLAWPGDRDPRAAWEAIPDLPANVVLLPDWPGEVVEIARDGRTVAEVRCAASAAPARIAGERPPFVIGLRRRSEGTADLLGAPFGADTAGIDYLALAGSGPRQTKRSHAVFAHHPGATQGLTARQTGPHGCTLVEVDAEGISRATFVPAAAVRREHFPLALEPHAHRDDLLDAMAAALRTRRAEPGERAWLCSWTISGTGRLFDELADERVRDELLKALAERETLPREVALHHEFRSTPAALDAPPHDAQAAEYFALLERCANRADAADDEPAPIPSLRNAIPAEWPVERDRLEPASVLGHARRVGDAWRAANIEEGSAT
ncbi:MAG: hypothetical protein WED34_15795 [Planctomycetales bacterium]